jgi:hypothetical protein
MSINSLFGTYTAPINNGQRDIVWTGDPLANMTDYLYRELGLYKKIRRNERAIGALNAPGQFLTDRNQKIIDETDRLAAIFRVEFDEAMNRGFTQEQAIKMAMEEVNYQKKKIFSEIDELYPTEISDRVMPQGNLRVGGRLGGKQRRKN